MTVVAKAGSFHTTFKVEQLGWWELRASTSFLDDVLTIELVSPDGEQTLTIGWRLP